MEAERRQLVILFADVVGYTTFSERFGEEAAFDLIQRLSHFVERVVQIEGARIQDILGDGVMVVFGAPVAREDAPLRACRAALSIPETCRLFGPTSTPNMAFDPRFASGSAQVSGFLGNSRLGGTTRLPVAGPTPPTSRPVYRPSPNQEACA